jgi:hypothetical protein
MSEMSAWELLRLKMKKSITCIDDEEYKRIEEFKKLIFPAYILEEDNNGNVDYNVFFSTGINHTQYAVSKELIFRCEDLKAIVNNIKKQAHYKLTNEIFKERWEKQSFNSQGDYLSPDNTCPEDKVILVCHPNTYVQIIAEYRYRNNILPRFLK